MSAPESRPRAIPAILLVSGLALVAALLSSRVRSRESLLPVLRAAGQQAKGLDRAVGSLMPLSPEDERRIGEQLDARLAPQAGPQAATARLAEFGGSAARSNVVRRFEPAQYRFRLRPSPAPLNAYALPGGFIHVTEPLLERVAGDDGALLFVLAHEIGHVELGHCADGQRAQAWFRQLGLEGIGVAASLVRMLAALQFSETQELEADAFAIRLLASIGEDPSAGLRAMDALGLTEPQAQRRRRSSELAREALGDYFRTHPGSWERRERLRLEIAFAARARPQRND